MSFKFNSPSSITPLSSTTSPHTLDFKHLLYQSQLLAARISTHLPSINRDVDQLASLTDSLLKKYDIKERFEADNEDLWTTFDRLTFSSSQPNAVLEPSKDQPFFVTGNNLTEEMEIAIKHRLERLIDLQSQQIREEGSKKDLGWIETALKEEWLKTKEKIIDEELAPVRDKKFGSSIEAPLSTEKGRTLAQIIVDFNEHRATKKAFNLVERFTSLTHQNTQLADIWEAVHDYVTPSEKDTENVFIAESKVVSRELIPKRARQLLEKLFIRFVDRTIIMYPKDAMAGGSPTIQDRIRAFVNVLVRRLPTEISKTLEYGSNSTPIYAIIFYLVRAGYWSEALSVARSDERVSNSSIVSYLAAFVDGNLDITQSVRASIQSEYAQRQMLAEQDPFKLTLLKIIGRCDLRKRTAPSNIIIQTAEDYIWLQLWLLCPSSIVSTSVISTGIVDYTLEDLQRSVCEFGPSHFDSSPLLYSQVLLWTGQLERFIAVLWMTPYRMDAVHFAITFANVKLLNFCEKLPAKEIVPEKELGMQDLEALTLCAITTWINGNLHILFQRVLSRYAKLFLPLDKSLAMHYVLLSGLVGSINSEYLLPFVTTGKASTDIEYWFGQVRKDGSREPGYLDRLSHLVDLSVLIQAAADRTATLSDRVHLLSLAGEYNQAVDDLVDHLLVDVPSSNEEDLSKMSIEILGSSMLDFLKGLPSSSSSRIDQSLLLALDQAITFSRFKRHLASLEYSQAMSLVESKLLLDLYSRQINLHTKLLGLTAELIEGYMNALYALYQQLQVTSRVTTTGMGIVGSILTPNKPLSTTTIMPSDNNAFKKQLMEKARAVLVIASKVDTSISKSLGLESTKNILSRESMAKLTKMANSIFS